MIRLPRNYKEFQTNQERGIDLILEALRRSGGTLDQVTTAGNTTNNTINVGGVTTDYVQLDTAATPTPAQGMIYWDQDEETAGLQVNGINYEIGQGLYWVGKNQTGSQINKGTAVYASGTLGASARILIAPMIADGSIDAKYFLGITAEDIADGDDGKVITQGKIRQINTTGYGAAGNVLWVSPTTAGALTQTQPTGTDLALAVAFVLDFASNGTMAVRVSVLDENAATGTPTLDQVTTAGNTTANGISVGYIEGPSVFEIYSQYSNRGRITLLSSTASASIPQIQFLTDGNVRGLFTKGGNLLIGTTTDAGYKLQVNGDATINGVRVGLGGGSVSSNTVVGYEAGLSNTTGTVVALGSQALRANTTGGSNTAVGYQAAYSNTSGGAMTAIGYQALKESTTSTGNTAVGFYSSLQTTTGAFNTSLGVSSLRLNTTGGYNTAIGNAALYNNTASNNTAVGHSAAYSNTSGTGIVALGYYALNANTTGINNTALGYQASVALTTGNDNTSVGYRAGYGNTTGIYNISIGTESNYSGNGSSNIAIGFQSLRQNSTGVQNTAVGTSSLRNNTASNNTAVGFEAAYSNTSGAAITALGYQALRANTANNNTAIGHQASRNNTTGHTNVSIGSYSLYSNLIGTSNVAIGHNSLLNNTDSNNTAVGYNAGYSNTTGTRNVFLGYQAGYNETGSYKLYIGNSSTNTLIYGDFSTGNVLIGTTTDAGYKLDVNGTMRTTGAFYQTTSAATGTLLASLLSGSLTIEKYEENGNNLGSILIKAKNNSSLQNSLIIDYGGIRSPLIVRADSELVTGNGNQGILRFASGSANYSWRFITSNSLTSNSLRIQSAYANSNPTWTDYVTILHQTQVGGGNVGIGTTSPAYRVDVQGTTLVDSTVSVQGAFNINPLAAPPAIGGYTLSAGTNLGVGVYYYFVTYVTALGETNASSTLQVTTTTGNTTVNLTGIPVSSDPRVTARKLYRSKVGFTSDNEYFLATINNNVTTTYTDSIADTSLTGANLQYYKVNTTARYFTVSGVQGMVIDKNLTAFGRNAGNAIIASSGASVRTVLVGADAGKSITTGQANVIVGVAGGNVTTGGSNTLIGDLAGYAINTGSSNTIIGSQSGRFLTTGSRNTIVGNDAGRYLADGTTQFTLGTDNTILGGNIRMFAANDANSIVIGYNARGLGSNTTVLGNSSTTFTAIPAGNMTIGGTVDAGYKLDVNGTLRTSGMLYAQGNVRLNNSASTTAWNGGYYVYQDSSNIYGLTLSYTGGSYYTTLFAPNPRGISFAIANPSVPTSQSDLVHAMFIKNTGNVLIGTTTDAGYKLDVSGNIRVSGINGYVYGDTTTPYLRLSTAAGSVLGYSTSNIVLGPNFVYNGAGVERFRINTIGNVGIGTNNPSQKLHVDGIVYAVTGFKLNNGYSISAIGYNSALRFNNDNILFNNSSAAESVRFVGSTGNVLIGTTTDAGYKLYVNGTVGVSGLTTTNDITLGENKAIRNLGSTIIDIDSDNNGTTSYFAVTKGGYVSSTTLLKVEEAGNVLVPIGNVGIGTNSPSSLLTINSAATLATGITFDNAGSKGYLFGDGLAMSLRAGSTYGITISPGSAGLYAFNSSGNFFINLQAPTTIPHYTFYSDSDTGMGRPTADTLTLFAGGERMRIASTGNVLIGTTTDAGYKLDVNGSVKFGTGLYWDNTNNRLGIGTSNPQAKLDISAGIIRLDDNRSISWATTDANIGRVEIYGNEVNDYILFKTDNQEKMRLISTGLGIGTTAPAGPLHVKYSSSTVPGITIENDGVGYNAGSMTLRSGTTGGTNMSVTVGGGMYWFNLDTFSNTLSLPATGNLIVGSAVDAGYRLDVQGGDARFEQNVEAASYSVAGNAGYSGIINFPGNPPGQQNLEYLHGILINVF